MARSTHVFAALLVTSLAVACVSEGTGSDADELGEGSGETASGTADGADTADTSNLEPCEGAPLHVGEATFYDFADGSGNCSFPATPDDLMVGAMNRRSMTAPGPQGRRAQRGLRMAEWRRS